ncbi:MAG: PrsW family intramembrane metalloprotease [Chloroflexi bacterium]|nr:PrsW family intramembrane metalloprotease [Chloroflexota bacterium]
MKDLLKWLTTLSGLLLMLAGVPALLGFVLPLLLLVEGESGALEFSLGWVVYLVLTLGCGGVAFFQGLLSLTGSPSRALRLPPTWALGGGFFLLLAMGLGLHAAVFCAPFGFPPVFLLAVSLPPVAAVAWMMDRQPGGVTWRRALVTFAAGATVSVGLAIVLEIVLPALVLVLVRDLGDRVLPAVELLLDELAGGKVAGALTSPGFLVALVEIAIIAPLAEEIAKPLITLPLLKRLKRPRDAVLVGAIAGAGFAALENVLYAGAGLHVWAGILLLRAMGAGIHPLGSGLVAWGWHDLLHRRPGAPGRWLARYGLAVGIHALWNGGIVLVLALVGANVFGSRAPTVNLLGVSEAGVLLAVLAVEGAAVWVGARTLTRRLLPVDEEQSLAASMPAERAIAVWALVCLLVLVLVGLTILRSIWLP